MRKVGRPPSIEVGFSLIEIIVVVAIIGILATITGLAVSGTSQKSRGATKDADEVTVTKAGRAYSAGHAQGRSPTLDGCLSGFTLDMATLTCGTAGTAERQFTVDETVVGTDVNRDGDATDTGLTVVPIIWAQFFTGDDDTHEEFNPDFADLPRHAFDLVGTTDGWKSSTGPRTEDSSVLARPNITEDIAAVKASGTVTVSSFASLPGEVVTADGTAFTAVSSAPGANEFLASTSDEVTATSLASAIDSGLASVDATAGGAVATITAATAGASENSITLVSSTSSLAVSGSTLTGGKDALSDVALCKATSGAGSGDLDSCPVWVLESGWRGSGPAFRW